ncbi:Putative Acetyl-CoA acyltransferase [Rhizopus microsporus]|uniref:acetyl-CoA C-acyltransferase n=2 Tax=Rhizopus microsporus TaxID=58291 RepID=A0A2G4T6M0_RHIZD|nr:thiolase [Rhizopus microsporus ATCC 52813]ORE05557.1 thiolase [Rhizopus microsporus var. microsporus]PHZ16665.1 thiolase [Rhizopus microsporus ATCC 52813]CEG63739.1 Putative Acetyl-CoA acyltransferase [Rhizopus microsporus]
MASRLQQVTSHLLPSDNVANKVGVKSPEDVVIVSALRSAITRARKGPFKDTLPEEILASVFKGIIDQTKIDPAIVNDIAVGNVLPPGGGATNARMAALYAGFPESAAVNTVNRQCSSGLQAVVQIATAIQAGLIEVGIGAGVESMTKNYGPASLSPTSEKIADACPAAADCLLPMGITSENVAAEFNVTRAKQDAFAAESHRKATEAQKNGWFKEEIVPIEATVLDKEEKEHKVIVDRDDGVRPGTTAEKLAKLRPAFDENGSTTAGNASQVSDGAAAVLLMKRKTAEKYGLPILGKYITSAVVGVPPRVMGIGPAFAIPVAVERAGLKLEDVDVYEINEAFASQAVYSIEKLGIPFEKVNPKGGAIAFGHPLGATGARQIATLFPELKRQNKKIGVTSMCIGTGMGMAAVFERE